MRARLSLCGCGVCVCVFVFVFVFVFVCVCVCACVWSVIGIVHPGNIGSYQDGYFIVLPHWEIRSPAP